MAEETTLARAGVIDKGQASFIVVGLLLLINPDIEIVSTIGALSMCVGYIPLGVRELKGQLMVKPP